MKHKLIFRTLAAGCTPSDEKSTYICLLPDKNVFLSIIAMHDIQGVLQMQQLKRMLSTEASGAQSE
jgi:hypothetical protein